MEGCFWQYMLICRGVHYTLCTSVHCTHYIPHIIICLHWCHFITMLHWNYNSDRLLETGSRFLSYLDPGRNSTSIFINLSRLKSWDKGLLFAVNCQGILKYFGGFHNPTLLLIKELSLINILYDIRTISVWLK